EAPRFNPMSYHNGSVWPHDVVLCAAGLARYGDVDALVRLMSGMFEAATHFGMRLPELFCGFERAAGEAPIACLLQAWAAGSVFMLLQACLGLELDAGRRPIRVDQPRLPDGIDHLQIRHLQLGAPKLDLCFQRLRGECVVALDERQKGRAPVPLSLQL